MSGAAAGARAARAADVPNGVWRLANRRGQLITVEGLWGAGKTTTAHRLGQHLRAAGVSVSVVHYGTMRGTVGRLSEFLEAEPLRSRHGLGGYQQPHHATIDVLLRLCREAYQHRTAYLTALTRHDVVIIDHGVYAKLAYALTVLSETRQTASADLLADLEALVAPWFLHPDLAIFLEAPWPLARERAIARGHGGGNPAAIERLLFLPRYEAAYRQVMAAHPAQNRPIRVGLQDAETVAAAVTHVVAEHLNLPLLPDLVSAGEPRSVREVTP